MIGTHSVTSFFLSLSQKGDFVKYFLDKTGGVGYNDTNSEKESSKLKILILYASRGGATETCARLLQDKLSVHHTPVMKKWEKGGGVLPDPRDYDGVIIGSYIRMGHMNRALRKYIKLHTAQLSSMKSGVFFCCGYPRQFDEYVDIDLPKRLTCSLGVHCFGGELKPDRLKGVDRILVKLMRNAILTQDFEESDADHHALPELIPENISILVEEIEKAH